MAFFKLIRWKNLLIVAATQYIMRHAVIEPLLSAYGFELQFAHFDFAVLVFATMALTAAGYTINDYFDTKTDLVNRPEEVVVGRKIPRRIAMGTHSTLNVLGVIAGFWATYKVGIYQLGFIFLIVAGLLWYYSTTYKRQFLIGNLLVALLTAMVPFMVILFEISLLNAHYGEVLRKNLLNLNHIVAWVGAFSYFAFFTTLAREIIKDMEDYEGDTAYGRNTLPIILGIRTTKIVVSVILTLIIASILWLWNAYLSDVQSLVYFTVLLIVPTLYLYVILYKAESPKAYRKASNVAKVIMLFGILYAIMVWYTLNYSI